MKNGQKTANSAKKTMENGNKAGEKRQKNSEKNEKKRKLRHAGLRDTDTFQKAPKNR